MADPFVAEIRIFPFTFAPKGWAFCNGQLMPLSQNTALFALLGTMYGGDGKSTFGLPDLQGRAPLSWGSGAGLTGYGQPGHMEGAETITLLQSEMPVHTHQQRTASQDNADVNLVSLTATHAPSTGGTIYQSSPNGQLAQEALAVAGGSLPHNNMQPYLTMNFCIALQGVFPPRQ